MHQVQEGEGEVKPNRVELEKLLAELERLKASGEYNACSFRGSGFSPWHAKWDGSRRRYCDDAASEFGITFEDAYTLFHKSKPNVDDQITFVRSLLKCEPEPGDPDPPSRSNKYQRTIKGTTIDVYDILAAYKVESHAIGHAVKKLLMAGQRGAKDRATDLEEAITAIQRAMEGA
jgi:hypothetical protein